VPPEDALLPVIEPRYSISSFKSPGAAPQEAAAMARMRAIAAFLGYDQQDLTTEEVLHIASLTERDLRTIGEVREEHKRELAKSIAGTDPNDSSNDPTCLLIGRQANPDPAAASELYTPSDIAKLIKVYFGGNIELDPALCELANSRMRARRFFRKEDNGLAQPWNANKIYVNPPFADMAEWVPKIQHEATTLYNGREKELFVLVPYREAEWTRQLLSTASLALLPFKKPLFWNKDREKISIRDPTALLYFGNRPKEVAHAFKDRFIATAPVSLDTRGTIYQPDDADKPAVMPPVPNDYDPVPLVHIGEKRDLTLEQRAAVEALVRRNKEVINPTPGRCRIAGARIDTGTNAPISFPLRQTSPAQRVEIEKQIQEMLKLGIIKPSTSPWAAGIVMAPKPDGSWRFCVDYRALNKVTVKDSYPLPRVDNYLHALEGNKWFSVMDLNAGFWQIPVHKDDQGKTAFLSHVGLFEWAYMPMGPINSPAVKDANISDLI
jgi:hypothetical protein